MMMPVVVVRKTGNSKNLAMMARRQRSEDRHTGLVMMA